MFFFLPTRREDCQTKGCWKKAGTHVLAAPEHEVWAEGLSQAGVVYACEGTKLLWRVRKQAWANLIILCERSKFGKRPPIEGCPVFLINILKKMCHRHPIFITGRNEGLMFFSGSLYDLVSKRRFK